MNLESNKATIKRPQQEVFDFLADVKNFEQIMPESIEKFESLDEKSFLFQLKGMPVLKLILLEQTPANKIVLGAKSDKLPFKLRADLQKTDDASTEFQLFFDGEFNAMVSMMIKSPIQKFINSLSDNLEKLFN